jgi:hypothetical protein
MNTLPGRSRGSAEVLEVRVSVTSGWRDENGTQGHDTLKKTSTRKKFGHGAEVVTSYSRCWLDCRTAKSTGRGREQGRRRGAWRRTRAGERRRCGRGGGGAPSHSPTPKISKLSVTEGSLRYSDSRQPENRAPDQPKRRSRTLSHPLRCVLFGRALALPHLLGTRPLARMEECRRAGPALIHRARKARAPRRHAAVGPDRRGHGGPNAVQRSAPSFTCVCLLGEDAESTKRLQLSEAILSRTYQVHLHPEGSLVLVFSRGLSHATLQRCISPLTRSTMALVSTFPKH